MRKQDLLDTAIKLAEQSEQYSAGRMAQISESEDLYYNIIDKKIAGLYNAPVPIMGGFIDTLISRVSGETVLVFSKQNDSDTVKAKKITAMWKKDSSVQYENWRAKDILAKKLAAFSGRAIYKIWAESDPYYKHHLEVIHYKDFICDPAGGLYLENHSYVGQKNIYKTKAQILEGIKRGIYESDAIDIFEQEKEVEDQYSLQKNTEQILGLQSNLTVNVPENTVNLYEMYLSTDDGRYYILFSKKHKKIVRVCKLKELKANEKWPYKSWATHPDLKVFWSKAPADDIKPIAREINTLVNQGLNNIQKRNFPQRAFDIKMFNDPTKLVYSPDAIIPVNSYGVNIGNGVYEFQTPDNTSIIINLISFLDGIAGLKTGVTADVQGRSSEKAVGIYYGNMEQIANRFGPTSIYYTNCWVELGIDYIDDLKEHLTEKQMIKLIGPEGIRWDTIKRDDVVTKEDLEINISATNQEMAVKEMENKSKIQALALLTNNPNYASKISPDFVIREILKSGGYSEDDITRALSVNIVISEEQLGKAAEVIEDFLDGKTPPMNFQADAGFVQKLVDFVVAQELPADVINKIYAYAIKHMPIVAKNTVRKAMTNTANAGANSGESNGISINNVPGITTLNIPNPTPNNVQERSQELTQQNK